MKPIINTKIDEYKDSDPGKAKDWQNAGLLLDMLAGGLSSPGDGLLGSLAGTANPLVAQTIKGLTDGTFEKGGLGHILAHGIAGAAMAAANGGDLLSGALTAGGAEALAPIIAEFLYGKGDNPNDLTADEKNTLSAIIGILGTGAGALTGDSAIDAVIGDSVATNAVENNSWIGDYVRKKKEELIAALKIESNEDDPRYLEHLKMLERLGLDTVSGVIDLPLWLLDTASAAFLADVTNKPSSSPFIFDDPISSLDQTYEELTVQRLVELSKTRQVINSFYTQIKPIRVTA